MPVLDRSELEASPLADLHTIANELGVDGFRLLPREQLISAILGEEVDVSAREERAASEAAPRARRARSEPRTRRTAERPASERSRARAGSSGARAARENVEGVVEVRDNGSAFLRVHPPGASDDDVYISPAQVKRCELSSGDRVSGPVRRPRRSERHASLARVETINGEQADTSATVGRSSARGASRGEGRGEARGEGRGDGRREPRRRARTRDAETGSQAATEPASDAAVSAFPTEPLAFASSDPTVHAVETLAPIGYGSRAVIVGASRAGKTELLRRMLQALAVRDELEVSLVLVGVRPEEIPEWEGGPVQPAAALSFASSPDEQGQAVEQALQGATRAAGRGRHTVVFIDTLDGLHPNAARRVLAGAQKLSGRSRRGGSGSVTVIGTATRPFGGETTVIALDVALASSGRFPAIDVMASGTLRPELLVGEEGAREIMRAHATYAPPARGWRRFWRR
jgi:transcription termination factor Rho